METLHLNISRSTIPSNGYRVFYKKKEDSVYTQFTPNPTTSQVDIPLPESFKRWDVYVQSDCGGVLSSKVFQSYYRNLIVLNQVPSNQLIDLRINASSKISQMESDVNNSTYYYTGTLTPTINIEVTVQSPVVCTIEIRDSTGALVGTHTTLGSGGNETFSTNTVGTTGNSIVIVKIYASGTSCESFINNSVSVQYVDYVSCGGTPEYNKAVNPNESVCIRTGTGGGSGFAYLTSLGTCSEGTT